MKKNILISGGTGFIGTAFIESLDQEKFNIHVIVRNSSNIYFKRNVIKHFYSNNYKSIKKIFEKYDIDYVIHFATLFITEHKENEIEKLVDSNITLGLRILEAMKNHNVKLFINTSSSWQYFDTHNDNYKPTNLYASTKTAFEKILDYYCYSHEFVSHTLIIYDTYGPNDKRGKIIPYLIKNYHNNITIEMSPGNQKLSFVHIDDIVDAFHIVIKDSLTKKSGHYKYKLNSDENYSLKQVVNMMNSVSKMNLKVNWGGREYKKREVMFPWQKGKRLPGWTPKINLRNGLKDLINQIEKK